MTARIVRDWRWSFRLFGQAVEELRIRPVGALHIGAHHGEEVPHYLAAGFRHITLVEPDPESCAVMAGADWIDSANIGIMRNACGQVPRTDTFHRTTETAFSGLQRHPTVPTAESFPVEIIPVTAIQWQVHANVLVIDTQGTELDVLRSAELASLDLIIIETQTSKPDAPGAYFPHLLDWCCDTGWAPRIQWQRDDSWSDTLLTPRRPTEPLP